VTPSSLRCADTPGLGCRRADGTEGPRGSEGLEQQRKSRADQAKVSGVKGGKKKKPPSSPSRCKCGCGAGGGWSRRGEGSAMLGERDLWVWKGPRGAGSCARRRGRRCPPPSGLFCSIFSFFPFWGRLRGQGPRGCSGVSVSPPRAISRLSLSVSGLPACSCRLRALRPRGAFLTLRFPGGSKPTTCPAFSFFLANFPPFCRVFPWEASAVGTGPPCPSAAGDRPGPALGAHSPPKGTCWPRGLRSPYSGFPGEQGGWGRFHASGMPPLLSSPGGVLTEQGAMPKTAGKS